MAPSSVRDLVIKDDDLVVGTHGRGIWILDDITPLRQIGNRQTATAAATRRRALQAADRVARALEHEHRHAAAARRADGAESARRRDHRLLPEVRGVRSGRRSRSSGADGKLVRRYSSDDEVFTPDPATIDDSALLVPAADDAVDGRRACIASRGTCTISRSTSDWTLGARRPDLPIAAIGHNTVPAPTTPWVNPGTYTVKLTVNGKIVHAADRRQAGSAREDAGAGDAAGLHAVEGDVRRRGRRAAGRAAGAGRARSDREAASRRRAARPPTRLRLPTRRWRGSAAARRVSPA